MNIERRPYHPITIKPCGNSRFLEKVREFYFLESLSGKIPGIWLKIIESSRKIST